MGFQKLIILFFLPLLLGLSLHKFYVSVTQVDYYAPDRAIQITSRVFTDDLEKAILERYGVELNLVSPQERAEADSLIAKYLRAKFAVRVNGSAVSYSFLGKKADNDILILFLEIPDIILQDLHSIEIQDEILMDVFEEQKNILHFRFGEIKKSFVLLRESSKGVLNF